MELKVNHGFGRNQTYIFEAPTEEKQIEILKYYVMLYHRGEIVDFVATLDDGRVAGVNGYITPEPELL